MNTRTKKETLQQRIDRLVRETTEAEQKAAEELEVIRAEVWADLASVIRQDVDPEMLLHVYPPDHFQRLEEDIPPHNFSVAATGYLLQLHIPELCPIRRLYERHDDGWRAKPDEWAIVVNENIQAYAHTEDEALVLAKRHYPDHVARLQANQSLEF